MTEFEAYKLYISIKIHFSNKQYDCILNHFKVKALKSSLEKRNDRPFFSQLAKHKDPIGLLISNAVSNPNFWVGDLRESDSSEELWITWKKKTEALAYTFKEDIKNLSTPFNDNFIVTNGGYPPVYKLYKHKKISLETLVILDILLAFTPYWSRTISETYVWPKDLFLIEKYRSFFNINPEKFKAILKSSINT